MMFIKNYPYRQVAIPVLLPTKYPRASSCWLPKHLSGKPPEWSESLRSEAKPPNIRDWTCPARLLQSNATENACQSELLSRKELRLWRRKTGKAYRPQKCAQWP